MQRRAVTAQQLLENPLLNEVVLAERDRIIAEIERAPLSDKDLHTRLIIALQISTAVQRNLWLAIQEGHEATHAIQMRGKRID